MQTAKAEHADGRRMRTPGTATSPRFVECGSCGAFHRADYWGDCRADGERYSVDDIERILGCELASAAWFEDVDMLDMLDEADDEGCPHGDPDCLGDNGD